MPNPNAFLDLITRFFGRKTFRSFAEKVNSLDALPADFRAALAPLLPPEDPARLILLAPPQSVLDRQGAPRWLPPRLLPWRITPERILALTSARLLVAARPYAPEPEPPAPVTLTPIPLAEVVELEWGYELLSAWFAVAWGAGEARQSLRVSCSAVSRPLFEELCASIRQAIAGQPHSAPGAPAWALLEGMPYAFQTLIRMHALLPGEPLLAAEFRPARPARPARGAQAVLRTPGWEITFTQSIPASHGMAVRFGRGSVSGE